MAAATPAAAPPATTGGSRGVSGTVSASAGAGAAGGQAPTSGAAAADGSAAPEAGAGVAPRPPPAAGVAGHASQSPLLQQPTVLPRQGQAGQSFGAWAPQQVPWQPQQQPQPYLPAPGGVCCIAPWASDTTRAGPLYVPPRGPSERVDDSAAAASASTAAAAAVYPDEAPLLCCEKKIRTVRDLGFWMSSSSYSHYVGFLRRLSLAVVEKKAWRVVPDVGARNAAGSDGTAAGAKHSSAGAAQVRPASGETSASQHTAGSTSSPSGRSSRGSSTTAMQTQIPLWVLEEGAYKDSSSSICRDSHNRSSSTTAETVCNAGAPESETGQQRPRRLSTEGLLTPTAAAAASEEMIEAALAAGSAEARQRAAALAVAATQDGVHVSDAVVQLLELLQQLLLWVEDIKPVEQPMRFGNKAFRNWLQRLETCSQRLLTPLIPALPRPAPAPLLCETIEEDPEREAAEAASSSPPPGIAAAANGGTVAGVSLSSASSGSFSSDCPLPQPARAAADALGRAPGGGNRSSSRSSRSSSGEVVGGGSSSEARAAEGNTAAAATASLASAAGIEEPTAAGSKDAAARHTDEVNVRVPGDNNPRSSTSRTGGSSTAPGSEPATAKESSSGGTASEEQKGAAEDTRAERRSGCGKGKEENEEEEHAEDSFVRTELLKELIDYLCHSFGDARRLDYGTGHEASFALFLLVLFEAHVLREGVDDAATVLLVFAQYVEVCHALQRRYSLEPAGSRGAWGLDDFHFLPFLFGSAQLQEQLFISPAQVMEPAVVQEMAAHNLYFSSIEYIMQTKRGAPFSECAPMLYDISGISSWKKIHAGLLRMYEGEVLNKFPIAQHFLFGRYFPLNLLDASGST